MSVLETFVHDPLVEWSHSGAHPELGNPQAQDALRTLQARLLSTPAVALEPSLLE